MRLEELGILLDVVLVREDPFEVALAVELFVKLEEDVPIFGGKFFHTVVRIKVHDVFLPSRLALWLPVSLEFFLLKFELLLVVGGEAKHVKDQDRRNIGWTSNRTNEGRSGWIRNENRPTDESSEETRLMREIDEEFKNMEERNEENKKNNLPDE